MPNLAHPAAFAPNAEMPPLPPLPPGAIDLTAAYATRFGTFSPGQVIGVTLTYVNKTTADRSGVVSVRILTST